MFGHIDKIANGMGKIVWNRISAEVFRNNQRGYLFSQHLHQEDIQSPDCYHLQDFEEHTIKSKDDHGTNIGIWYKQRTDPSKPIYIAFHGRSGHWGWAGDYPKSKKARNALNGCAHDHRYRIDFLRTMAETGAGVVAIHSRGFGLSKNGEHPVMNEPAFQKDIDAIAEFIQKMDIDPRQVVIVGESLGGAFAAMLAETFTKTQKAPAAVGLINSFSTMGDGVHDIMHKNVKFPEWIPNWISDKYVPREPAKHVPREMAHGIVKASHRQFDTKKRLKDLPDGETHLYVAHAPGDQYFSMENPASMEQAFKDGKQKSYFKLRILEDDYLLPGRKPHVGWDPQKIVADLEDVFKEHKRAATRPSFSL